MNSEYKYSTPTPSSDADLNGTQSEAENDIPRFGITATVVGVGNLLRTTKARS